MMSLHYEITFKERTLYFKIVINSKQSSKSIILFFLIEVINSIDDVITPIYSLK